MTKGNVNVIQRERMGWAACHSEGAERPKESKERDSRAALRMTGSGDSQAP